MLSYFKRVGDLEGPTGTAPKRPRSRAPGSSVASPEGKSAPRSPSAGGDPKTIVTWNANGLGVRLSKDWQELKDFLLAVKPDLCCIQEVRFAAAGLPKCKRDDNRGRKRGQLKVDTTADRKDRDLLQGTLRALADRLGYRLVLSLANYKYSGTAVLIRNTCAVSGIYYSLTPEGLSKEHNPEGRVIALELPSATVVVLYVPNNGVKEESFRRREEWDSHLRAFVEGYDRPLIIAGDLNVAHEDADLTHPSFFKRQCPAQDPRNSGQPGCTPAERERHSQLLACGAGLVDAYRLLHRAATAPVGGSGNEAGWEDGGPGVGTDTEGITWRGTAGSDFAEMGKFYGKGMRIDYFLMSRPLAHLVAEVKVFGSGADRKGFLGSDHSPVLLTLHETGKSPEPVRLPGGEAAICGQDGDGGDEQGGNVNEAESTELPSSER